MEENNGAACRENRAEQWMEFGFSAKTRKRREKRFFYVFVVLVQTWSDVVRNLCY